MSGRTVYSELDAVALAEQASESVRGLNHLTRDSGSLRHPVEVYQALGSLAEMCERLPQTLEQIEVLLTRWVEQDQVRIDDGEFIGDPPAAAAAVSVWLTEEAPPALDRLAMALRGAEAALACAGSTADVDGED